MTWALDVVEFVREESKRLGYAWFDAGDYDLNLFGVRSSAPIGSNAFDDLVGVACRVNGIWDAWMWPATTDPGRPYLGQPLRPDGTAVLEPGQHRALWRIGKHKGRYEALVQWSPAPYRRYPRGWRPGDPIPEPAIEKIGLNLHRAGTASTLVGAWSAGCQVLQRSEDLAEVLGLAKKQAAKGPGWDAFTYTLFDAAKSPALSALFHVRRAA